MRSIVAGVAVPLAMATPAPEPPEQPAVAEDRDAAPLERPAPARHLLARIRRGQAVRVHASPGGREIGRLDDRTQFGSPHVVPVYERRGGWLGVSSVAGPNGRLGWIRMRRSAIDLTRTVVSLRADLSRRVVELRRGRQVVQRFRVTIGARGSSTPTGRFGVTDKLPGSRFSRYYGCCILALGGRQPNLPAGWSGGDRLGIHGTNAPGQIGEAASAGCLRAADRPLRRLMRQVPLGAPVVVVD